MASESTISALDDFLNCMNNGDTSEFRKRFNKIIEMNPRDPMCLLARCFISIMEGRCLDAISDALAVLELDDTPVQAILLPGCTTYHSTAYFCLTQCYSALGQTENYQTALERHKEIEERVAKEKANAVDSSTEASENKTRVEQLKQKGNEHFRAGDYYQAIQAYSEALKLDPNNHILHSNVCQAALRHGKLSLAKHHAIGCVTLKPSWPKGYYRLGTVLLQQGEYSGAIEALEKAKCFAEQQGMPYDAALAALLEDARAKQANASKELTATSSVKNTQKNVNKMSKGVSLDVLVVLISVGLIALAAWYLQYRSRN
jgi:tetratricopeptide (TPR) repeat protein